MAIRSANEALMNLPPRIRTFSKRKRSSEWWDVEVLQFYDDEQWIADFRMNRQIFFRLVDLLKDKMAPAENTFVEGLSVEKKIAIAVYKLASCAEYRVIAKGFGVSKSTVCLCVHSFCKVLIENQVGKILSWPNALECERIASRFEQKFKLPNIIGVIDGTHVPIKPPQDGAADFRNRKGYSSIAVQAIVDDQYLFKNITAQNPGCAHDASVLRGSSLYKNHNTLIPESHSEIDGIYNASNEAMLFKLPYYIIGDAAYPLCNWIMKNYRDELTVEETSFNLYLNQARIVVEQAFGRLKGRWRILYKKSDLDVYNMPHVIIACGILHNFVEISKQRYNSSWDVERIHGESEYPQPEQMYNRQNSSSGHLMRDHICAYLARKYPLLHRSN
ncbi:protein ALP1-like [Teleopsis dalmanni]|uniref:protein ALP1-like n=1 Tax=Teleopsis dalmanni TaxID=139649 RepID=UPI0018CF8F8B|nr:protein ALP1-like [Teleopsis dalmanni]